MKKPLALVLAALSAVLAAAPGSWADDPSSPAQAQLKAVSQGGDSDGWRFDSTRKAFVKDGYQAVFVGDSGAAKPAPPVTAGAVRPSVKTHVPSSDDPHKIEPPAKPGMLAALKKHPLTWIGGGGLLGALIGLLALGPFGFLVGGGLGLMAGAFAHHFFVEKKKK